MPHLYEAELYHHGILGQKHGRRNGPPYPLQSSQFSSAQRKAGAKESKWADGTPKGYKPKKKSVGESTNTLKKDYYKSRTKAAKAKLKKAEEKKKVVTAREKAIAAKHEAKLAKMDVKYARKYERQQKKLQKLEDKNELKAKKEQFEYNKRYLKRKDIGELSADELMKNMDLYSKEEIDKRIGEFNTEKNLRDIKARDLQRATDTVRNLVGLAQQGINAYNVYAQLTGKETVEQRGRRIVNEKLNKEQERKDRVDYDKNLREKRRRTYDDAITDATKKQKVAEYDLKYKTDQMVKNFASTDENKKDAPKDVLSRMSKDTFLATAQVGGLTKNDIEFYMRNVEGAKSYLNGNNNNGGGGKKGNDGGGNGHQSSPTIKRYKIN